MNQRSQNKIGFFSQFRLTRVAAFSAILLTFLLTVKGISIALAVDTPDLISPPEFAETTGNPSDPISGRVLYEPLGIPTFEWENVGAIKYELEVATTAAFGSSIILNLDNLEYTTYTPNGDGELGTGFSLSESSGEFIDVATFYWRVRAWDDTTNGWGVWSDVWSFDRHWGYQVELVAPANGSVETKTPIFTWEPVPGASFYQIQVDSSDSFGSLLASETVDVPVYTPLNTLQNDSDLFWRVRAFHRPNANNVSGGKGGPWSDVHEFQLAWSSNVASVDRRPTPVIPPNNANYVSRPIFCWEPVEGANKYSLDLATHPGFIVGSTVFLNKTTEGTCFYTDRDGTYTLHYDTLYYWRVKALDARGFPGQSTDTGVGSAPFQFRTAPSEPIKVPAQLYPKPYYTPVMDDTFDDPTAANPTFVWDHVRGATGYELRIDDDVAMTDPAIAVITTDNASYTFTDADTYPLTDGAVYYWRVRPLGVGAPSWAEMLNYWPVRIDRNLVDVNSTVKLIQPTFQSEPWTSGYKYGHESVTYYPSFSWTAVAPIGDATYQIEIAYDDAFTNLAHDAQTNFTEYTPTDLPEPGTYFWRVRRVAPTTGSWSNIGRFIVSRNFTYSSAITLDGDSADWISAGIPFYSPSGEDGDASSEMYDLDGLYITNDSINWYFGINLSSGIDLGIFLDTNHFDLLGGTQPPPGEGNNPGFQDAHQPEFAIYLSGDQSDIGNVYEWNGSSWTNRGTLNNISASHAYSSTNGFLELEIPVTQINQPGSLSVMMVTLDGSGVVQDILPNLPGQTTEATSLTESTTPTPLYPANAPEDATLSNIEHNTPILTWRHNEGGYFGSYFYQTFEDETLTNLYDGENGNVPRGGLFWAYNTYWAPKDFYSDNNSYHWQIGRAGFEYSVPIHFQKAAYLPTDLQFSPTVISDTLTFTNRTPDFSWQPAQSAPKYVYQLWESGNLKDSKLTMVPYYTPQNAIEDGTYTWKVFARDPAGRDSAEAAQGEFSKVSDIVPVKNVEYTDGKLVFNWEPVDFAAQYRIEIADDPQFSIKYWYEFTYNTTFTPRTMPSATDDGVFYWRVFMIDNRNHAGPYIDLKFDPFPEKIYLPLLLR